MTNAKHTPGTWEYYENGSVGKDGTKMYTIGFGVSGMLGEVVGEANALLISAAPEMLEALNNIRLYSACPKAVNEARQAIAKAEGK